ncbi:F0F1 ATP synthase subunit delta, partial [Acinetobacter baumannii]
MADKTTIARPYAKAAFEEARSTNRLGAWSEALSTAAVVAQDPRILDLLGNPAVTDAEL